MILPINQIKNLITQYTKRNNHRTILITINLFVDSST